MYRWVANMRQRPGQRMVPTVSTHSRAAAAWREHYHDVLATARKVANGRDKPRPGSATVVRVGRYGLRIAPTPLKCRQFRWFMSPTHSPLIDAYRRRHADSARLYERASVFFPAA